MDRKSEVGARIPVDRTETQGPLGVSRDVDTCWSRVLNGCMMCLMISESNSFVFLKIGEICNESERRFIL